MYVVDIFYCIFTWHDFGYKISLSYDSITWLKIPRLQPLIPSGQSDIGAHFCPLI